MQFYALHDNQSILVSQAEKSKAYRCPECLNSVRVRGGPHRQIHFYHIRRQTHCRQHQKTLFHLQAQLAIQSLLPAEEGALEKPFPQIGRIADVAWESKKIIFEIQCSPISLEEAKGRCEDYAKLGLTPVWILHDRRFNHRKMSAAENFLRTQVCYFTNINEKGEGIFYDQQDECWGNRRLFKGPKFKVDVREPFRAKEARKPLPQKKRRRMLSLKEVYKIFFYWALESLCAKPK